MIIERIHSTTPYFKSGAKIQAEQKHTFAPDAVVFEKEKQGGSPEQHLAQDKNEKKETEAHAQAHEETVKAKPSVSSLDILA